jgi:hypothetical protein
MSLYERLTTDDKDFFINQVSSNADYSENRNYYAPKAPLSYILRYWNTEKETLYKVLGETLILEKELVYTCPREEVRENMWQAMSGDPFLTDYRSWLRENIVRNYSQETKITGFDILCELIVYDTLAENVSPNEQVMFAETKTSEIIRIDAGCKVIRLLSKLNKKYINSPHFEAFRIKHSMVLNSTKAKGTLCLSIHPNDYITMSDNAYDWDSCMSWESQGDYKAGTIEMMNSSCVVIAYLQGDKDSTRWFNKKWRELFIVTPEIITGIKDYPYHNETLETICMEWLRELATNKEDFGNYSKTIYKIKSGEYITDINSDLKFSIFPSGWMYNDYYGEHPAFIREDIKGDNYTIDYSGVNNCLICGDSYSFDNSCQLACNDCVDVHYCECCESYFTGEAYTDSEGYVYCNYCYQNHSLWCDHCNQSYFEKEVHRMVIFYNDDTLNNLLPSYFCESCINSQDFIQLFGEGILEDSLVYVQLKNFSAEGFDYFNLDPKDYPIEK